MLSSGRLRENITFYAPIICKDEFGANKTLMQKVFTAKSNVVYKTGSRVNENNEIAFAYSVSFEIRIYHKISEYMQIEYNYQRYRIKSIQVDKANQKKIIEAELINE